MIRCGNNVNALMIVFNIIIKQNIVQKNLLKFIRPSDFTVLFRIITELKDLN